MKKILSIIIPTYNMEMYLPRCIDSLIKDESIIQYLEIIIVNDGSKDNSLKIAQEYQSKNKDSINIINKINGNYGSCINSALKIATGKYVKILDADDWFDNKELAKFIQYLQKNESDLVLTNYIINYVSGEKKICKFNMDYNIQYDDTIMLSTEFQKLQMHSVCYRTSLLKEIEYQQTEGISYTDQEWVFYPMEHISSIRYCNIYLYQYLLGRSGQTMDNEIFTKKVWQQIIIVKKMINKFTELQESSNISTNQYKYFYNRLLHAITGIYKTILFSSHTNLKELDDFSAYIKEKNRNLYFTLENSVLHKYLPYKYISKFHHSHKYPNKIISTIYRKIKKIYH